MHKIRFSLWLHHRPRQGSLQRSRAGRAVFKGPSVRGTCWKVGVPSLSARSSPLCSSSLLPSLFSLFSPLTSPFPFSSLFVSLVTHGIHRVFCAAVNGMSVCIDRFVSERQSHVVQQLCTWRSDDMPDEIGSG